jgi:DoxX
VRIFLFPAEKCVGFPRTFGNMARWAPLPLRLIVGFGFIAHGYAKLAKGPDAFVAILHAIGVPAPYLMAWLTIGVELFGGLAGTVHGMARNRRLYRSGSSGLRSPILKWRPNLTVLPRDGVKASVSPRATRQGPFRTACRRKRRWTC